MHRSHDVEISGFAKESGEECVGRSSLKIPSLRTRLIIVFARQIMRIARLEIPRRQPPNLSRFQSKWENMLCVYLFDHQICVF